MCVCVCGGGGGGGGGVRVRVVMQAYGAGSCFRPDGQTLTWSHTLREKREK